MSAQSSIIENIDDALEIYCRRCGDDHFRDVFNNGLLRQFIIDEELDDSVSAVNKQLGENCDPHNCTYSWMADSQFPVPNYAILTNTKNTEYKKQEKQLHAFIFYILQYCKKYKEAPCDKYIREQIIPDSGGSIKHISGVYAYKQ
eukprot:533386_1